MYNYATTTNTYIGNDCSCIKYYIRSESIIMIVKLTITQIIILTVAITNTIIISNTTVYFFEGGCFLHLEDRFVSRHSLIFPGEPLS